MMNTFFSKQLGNYYWIIKKIPLINKPISKWMYENTIYNLGVLNETLSDTLFAKKYWIMGGMLLGWIRDQDILPGDEGDIDFAFHEKDEAFFLDIIPILEDAGFQPYKQWKNNAGVITEYVFIKDGCKYEYFLMFEHDGKFQYYGYSKSKKGKKKSPFLEAMGEINRHGLIPMQVFDWEFLVPEDPVSRLAEMYEDWEKPNPGYRFIDDEITIVSKEVWKGNYEWGK